MVINGLLRELTINLVDYYFPEQKNGRPGRPRKCTNEQCVDAAFEILRSGDGWEYLKGYPIKGDSIRKRISNWNNANIFKKAWIIFVNIHVDLGLNFNDLFIDASHIKNYNGQDIIGRNFYDRFKTSTKLSIIVDEHGIPIGITLGSGNKHDSTFVGDALNSIDENVITYMDTQNLIGDKGYWSSDVTTMLQNKYKMKIITPSMITPERSAEQKALIKELNDIRHEIKRQYRRLKIANNELQTIKNRPVNKRKIIRSRLNKKIGRYKRNIKQLEATKRKKERIKHDRKFKKRGRKSEKDKKLAKRYVVELAFSWFKKYGRLRIRKDKNFTSFESFIFFGAANIVANSLSKHT